MMLSVRNIAIFFAVVCLSAIHAFAQGTNFQDKSVHIFGLGDVIHIDVKGENELTKDYEINDAGMIQMPLIGDVHVAGLAASEIEKILTAVLKDGYIWNPVISVRAAEKYAAKTSHKNGFYILGEVRNPGHYAIPDDTLNILKAVALAGGFTHRANKQEFEIMRNENENDVKIVDDPAKTKLYAGDLIIVKERFF